MNTQQTLAQLKELKLEGMYDLYKSVINTPVNELPGVHHLVARLAEAESLARANKKMASSLKNSKMRYNAVLEQIECSVSRNLSKDQIEAISDCSFINRGQNILISGAAGVGKSYLACAIGRQCCMFGYKVIYMGILRFTELLTQGKLDGSYIKIINKLNKADVIILDDFGLQPLGQHTRIALLQILEDRYGLKSIIVTSQYPVSEWHSLIQDPTLSDALLDRLTANAHRFCIKGDSMRRRKSI